MKKIYLSALLAFSVISVASAQQSAGGFPLSSQLTKVQDQKVANISLTRPDYDAILKKDEADAAQGLPSPYKVATLVNSDISLTNSGSWYYLDDGSKIWRLAVSVPDAKAVGFYYDQFYLPEGVKLFVSNENGRQIMGAYTAANNDKEYKEFANMPVQGAVAVLEMDIPATVSVNSIIFHINQVAAYYRSVSYLQTAYATDNSSATPAKPTGVGDAAPCQIDANCPLPAALGLTSDYHIDKDASVQITIRTEQGQAVGLCSGTLINNTANGQNSTCVPYVLTASHCDEDNSFASSHFAQWLFRFKYRFNDCGGSVLPDPSGANTTMIGADFKARSYFPSFPGGSEPKLVGDFILLQLKTQPLASYNTYLAGWNRNLDIASNSSYYDFFIGFHYPHGDVEKQSYGFQVQANGTFNQTQVNATHWYIPFVSGGSQPGSSGSGLFDVDGRLIGDLSGGTSSGCDNNPANADFGTEGLYSKIAYNWTNDFDQTNHPRPVGQENQSRLKDWLDPGNTGAMTVDAVTPDCTPTAILQQNNLLDNNIDIYPTPSTDGTIYVKTRLDKPTNLKVDVYNTLGRLVKEFTLTGAYAGNYSFDCAGLSNGLYMMKFISTDGTTTKKIVIAR